MNNKHTSPILKGKRKETHKRHLKHSSQSLKPFDVKLIRQVTLTEDKKEMCLGELEMHWQVDFPSSRLQTGSAGSVRVQSELGLRYVGGWAHGEREQNK